MYSNVARERDVCQGCMPRMYIWFGFGVTSSYMEAASERKDLINYSSLKMVAGEGEWMKGKMKLQLS